MLSIKQRHVERAVGFLAALATFCFLQIVWEYQSSHCKPQHQNTAAAPPYEQKVSPAAAEPQSHNGDQKIGKHQKTEPSFACGVTSFPAAMVAFMDDHEGFFVGAFTAILAISTTLLWRSTAGLYEAGERQFGLAEKQFLATHRPELFAHTFETSRDFHDDGGQGIGVNFTVTNRGTADAMIRDIFGRTLFTDQLRPGIELPSLGYEGCEVAWGSNLRNIAIFGSSMLAASVDLEIGYGKPGKNKLWCIGKIAYGDQAGRGRETGFCLSFDVVGERWVREPESGYEYSY